LDFAEETLQVASELGLALHEDAAASAPTEQQSRVAIDELRQWIANAGKAEDLERHIIGGLRKTVMRDGRIMWLSAAAAAEWDSVSPEQPVVSVEEPEDFKGTNIIDESTELESAQLLGNDSSRSTEVAEMFERFDADGNGFLSQAECRAAATALFPDVDWEVELWPALCEAYGADPAKGMDVAQFGSFVQQAEEDGPAEGEEAPADMDLATLESSFWMLPCSLTLLSSTMVLPKKVSAPVAITIASSSPCTTTAPLSTSSPTFLITGRLSPVRELSSSCIGSPCVS
jgi:hypothetical protein